MSRGDGAVKAGSFFLAILVVASRRHWMSCVVSYNMTDLTVSVKREK